MHAGMFGNIQSLTDDLGQNGSEEPAGSRSKVSCNVCRKRKVRCTKELPKCIVCSSSSQACSYPKFLLKRGPKIGSRQSKVRRTGDRLGCRPTHLGDDAEMHVLSGVHYSDEAMTEQEDSAHLTPLPLQSSSSRPKDDILALSYILHPAHEKLSPEGQYELPARITLKVGTNSIFDSTCWKLGLTPELLQKLYVNGINPGLRTLSKRRYTNIEQGCRIFQEFHFVSTIS
jgi:hypothetical protein